MRAAAATSGAAEPPAATPFAKWHHRRFTNLRSKLRGPRNFHQRVAAKRPAEKRDCDDGDEARPCSQVERSIGHLHYDT